MGQETYSGEMSVVNAHLNELLVKFSVSHRCVWCSSLALATCETSQVLLAGVSGGFSRGSPVFAHLLIGPSHMS